MNVVRLIVTGLRAYFWLVLGAVFVVSIWAVNRYLIDFEGTDIGWVAVAGFGAVLAIFLFSIQRLTT